MLAPGQSLQLLGLKFEGIWGHHHESSLGYRVTTADDTIVAIPGDTAFCPELVSGVRRADVLVTECAGTDENR